MAKYDEFGREVPDPTPVEVPLEFRRVPMSIEERIARSIEVHMSQLAAAEGKETFEEANDFSDEDDEDPVPTAFELQASVDEDTMTELARRQRQREREEYHGRRGKDGKVEGAGRVGKEAVAASESERSVGEPDRKSEGAVVKPEAGGSEKGK